MCEMTLNNITISTSTSDGNLDPEACRHDVTDQAWHNKVGTDCVSRVTSLSSSWEVLQLPGQYE